MRAPLTIAVAQPTCTPCDVGSNALVHASMVRSAGARVVVFPELSLTGYELGTALSVSLDSPALQPIIDACAEARSVTLLGAPVQADGKRYIAMLAVDATGVTLAYRKMWLGEAESQWFAAGDKPAVLHVDGWRLGLAICKDTGTPRHRADTAALGMDCYVAGLVMFSHEATEQDERGRRIATDLDVYVAMASFAGPTGGGYGHTAGGSAIWSPRGEVLAKAGAQVGEVVKATIA
jgi:predicted amidohydrolase